MSVYERKTNRQYGFIRSYILKRAKKVPFIKAQDFQPTLTLDQARTNLQHLFKMGVLHRVNRGYPGYHPSHSIYRLNQ